MTPEEYAELLNLIKTDHGMLSKKGRSIKYVSSNYDTRDNTVYAVSLREWFKKDTKQFIKSYCDNLLETIKDWLANS